MTAPRRTDCASRARGGFTILELTVVLVLVGLGLGFAGATFSGYFQRSSARQAAQIFAQDLRVARSAAMRAQEPVVIRFFESNQWYQVVAVASGTELVRRSFGVNADLPLNSIDLRLRGDSLLFSARGVAIFRTTGNSTLGEARFIAGGTAYGVMFNSLGTSKIEVTRVRGR